MSELIPSLEPGLRQLLRAADPPPDGARERVRARLELAIPAMLAVASGGPAPVAAHLGTPRWARHAAFAATFVAGGITGAALLATLASKPTPQIIYVDRPVASSTVAPVPVVPLPPLEPSPPPSPATSTPLVTLPTAHGVVVAPAPASMASSARGSQFAQERMLLDEARAALGQGDAERALGRLDAHRVQFADGLLAEERDAMRVQALVRLAHYDEARAAAAAFRARSPGSLFTPTVESSISSIPAE